MNKILCAVLATAVFYAGSNSVDAQSLTVSDGVVRIGVLTDMSGVFSDLAGAGSVTAAQMAIDDFKATKKPSFKVELVTADHQNKADVASSKAREWMDKEGLAMLVGGTSSGTGRSFSRA